MCSLEKWSRFSFRYVNFNVHMDLLNIFSSLWELISFGALALPGRTCLFCLTPELDSVLAILAKSCLGAVLCQMWVWKILDLNIWKSENSRCYITRTIWNSQMSRCYFSRSEISRFQHLEVSGSCLIQ